MKRKILTQRIKNILSSTGLILILIMTGYTTSDAQKRKPELKGSWNEAVYENGYFKIQVPEGWFEQLTKEKDQFLVVARESEHYNPNLVFMAIPKKEYSDKFKINNLADYSKGITESIHSNPAHEVVSENNNLTIDGRAFTWNEFVINRPDKKKLIQRTYVTEMDGYYLTILSTEDSEAREPQITEIINSIDFK
jgi:hypothetical protein